MVGVGTPFHANPYLNVVVFGTNLGSALNDIGVLLVCSVLKEVGGSFLVKRISTLSRPSRLPRHTVEPALQRVLVFNSQAPKN